MTCISLTVYTTHALLDRCLKSNDLDYVVKCNILEIEFIIQYRKVQENNSLYFPVFF